MITLKAMTMRITKHQTIGGLSVIDVRNILRKYREFFSEEWLEEAVAKLLFRRKFGHGYFYRNPETARAFGREALPLIQDLVAQGLIELDQEQTERESLATSHSPLTTAAKWYKLTERGHELTRATAAKPVHRKSGEEAMHGLLERVRIVNQEDRFLFRVTAVVLYGSYLRGAERLADVDVAIEVERKIEDFEKHHEACWKLLEDRGRACRRTGYELEFPRLEVFVFLKHGKRTLSLHPLHDFLHMKKRDNFSYEVLFGDKDAIAQKLR